MKRLSLYYRIIWIIKEITRKRMSNIFHMHTNLMSSSSRKFQGNKGKTVLVL